MSVSEKGQHLIVRRGLVIPLAAILCLVTNGARASEPANYQKYIIGERALGMGGAHTAAVRDPSACYYNPGAMVFSRTSMISASQNLYSLDYRFIEGGFVPQSEEAINRTAGELDAVTLEHKQDLTVPSTIALMLPFGSVVAEDGGVDQYRQAVGVSLLVPYQDSYTLRAKWVGEGLWPNEETYSLTESFRNIWTGTSYALRLSPKWGLGFSAYITQSQYRRRLDVNRVENLGVAAEDGCELARCGLMAYRESLLRISVVSLAFRIGALFVPNPHWRIGLTVSPPSVQIGNLGLVKTSGSLDQTAGTARVTNTDDDYIDFFTDDYGLRVKEMTPFSARLGAAYFQNDNLVVDLDVSVHAPVRYDRIIGDAVAKRWESSPETASPEWFDPGIVKRIIKRPVVNINLGEEVVFGRHWTFRGGVFTDFSSAPELSRSATPQLTRAHRFGASLSIGFQNRGYDITLGAMGSAGNGMASRYNPLLPEANDARGSLPWEPVRYQERSIYIFVSGMQKALAKTARKMWKRAKERLEEGQVRESEQPLETEDGKPAPSPRGEQTRPAPSSGLSSQSVKNPRVL